MTLAITAGLVAACAAGADALPEGTGEKVAKRTLDLLFKARTRGHADMRTHAPWG